MLGNYFGAAVIEIDPNTKRGINCSTFEDYVLPKSTFRESRGICFMCGVTNVFISLRSIY